MSHKAMPRFAGYEEDVSRPEYIADREVFADMQKIVFRNKGVVAYARMNE